MKGIKQLARHLDISIGTVSRALNGKPDVNPETRKRVLEAAEAFGYAPNQSGRSLRQGTTNAIGFMIELSADTNAASDDFFMSVFDGVQAVLSRHKLDLVVFPCPVGQRPVEYLQRIVGRRLVDAMIISATCKIDARIEFLNKAGIPFIALGRSDSGENLRWIDLDFEGVASSAVDRLAARGHRRIAIGIPSDDINFGHVYHEAYRSGLARHGISYDPALVFRQDRAVEGGHGLATQIVRTENPPTAILLATETAPSLYRGLVEYGVMPGKDIAIIGFRDNPRSRYLTPSLTCHAFSLPELGKTVAETLLADMPNFAKYYPDMATNKIWPVQLVQGDSDDFTLPAKT
jgi:DNA-binding LacI/PurR family transcriptional regulator